MLIDRGVDERLAATPAVAVERFAAGGGGTAWYRLERQEDLATFVAHIRPGSDIRFAFGDAFAQGPFDSGMAALVNRIGAEDINAVILARGDGFELEHDFPSTAAEAAAFVGASRPLAKCGSVDSRAARRMSRCTCPDRDGVTRPHPY